MSRFIAFLRFTELGAKNLKKSTARARAFDQAAAKAGVTIDAQFWTFGRYDGVLVLSADSEVKVLRLLTQLTAAGNVRTETLRAFSGKEFASLLRR